MKKLAYLIIPAALSACATSAPVKYEELKQRSSFAARTPIEALQLAEPIDLILNEEVKSEIELSDPALQLDDIVSNYEIFSFTAEEDFDYVIDLLSLCSCIGKKRILYPVSYLLDSDGVIVNATPTSIQHEDANWSLPDRIHGVWEGRAKGGETYYFLVAADNSDPGSEVASASGLIPVGYAFVPFSVSLRSSPEGKIRVKLSANAIQQ